MDAVLSGMGDPSEKLHNASVMVFGFEQLANTLVAAGYPQASISRSHYASSEYVALRDIEERSNAAHVSYEGSDGAVRSTTLFFVEARTTV